MDTDTLLTLAANPHALAATTMLSNAINAITQSFNDYTCSIDGDKINITFKRLMYPMRDDVLVVIHKDRLIFNEVDVFDIIIDGADIRHFDEFAQVIGFFELKLT